MIHKEHMDMMLWITVIIALCLPPIVCRGIHDTLVYITATEPLRYIDNGYRRYKACGVVSIYDIHPKLCQNSNHTKYDLLVTSIYYIQ